MEFAVTLSNVLVDNGFDFVDPFKNICGCIGNTWGVDGHRIVVNHGRDIYVEDINGELEECYEMMYKEPVQESDIRGLVLDTVSKFYHNIRDGR